MFTVVEFTVTLSVVYFTQKTSENLRETDYDLTLLHVLHSLESAASRTVIMKAQGFVQILSYTKS